MKHSLYYTDSCPFCHKVMAAARQLPVSIELRNVQTDAAHLQALRNKGGRLMVPCLRIEKATGAHWMYESDDIIAYLSQSP